MIIRDAKYEDSYDIREWRNDVVSRDMSFSSDIVTIEEHEHWMNLSLSNTNRILLICIDNKIKLGVCRFDICPDSRGCEISINMNPQVRGKGFAVKLLIESISYFLKKHSLDYIIAEIKNHNVASQKCFTKAGFTLHSAGDVSSFYKYKTT